MNNNHRKKFYNVLKDIFIGAKIKGKGGYVNLMQIKSLYYNQFEKELTQEIDKTLTEVGEEFREEMYRKLYTFFKRYFSESGSIFFSHTPVHEKVYEKIYSDEKDVMLFWKTKDLYYVKTEQIFNDLEVEIKDYNFKFLFNVSQLKLKQSNEKKRIIFELDKVGNDGVIVCKVVYASGGRKTKLTTIHKEIKKIHKKITIDIISSALSVFKKQSEVDFFIHKNAKEFLREQFNFWIKGYLVDDETLFSAERLMQLKGLKKIATLIIDVVSQFENELVKIWNKPKFVRNSNYIITLDKIAEKNEDMIKLLLNHSNINKQKKEWEQLGIVSSIFEIDNITSFKEKKLFDVGILNPKYKNLPIDTKYFKDLEVKILGLFPDLDEALDGWLIHSENYQALNTIKKKFTGKVQAIYIDPPYNTNASEITYINHYKSSSWLSLMEDRISISKSLLKETGAFCLTIDDFEYANILMLLNSIFGKENYLATALVRNNPSGRSTVKGFAINHEYGIFYSKSEKIGSVGRLPHNEKQVQRYKLKDSNGKRYEWENLRRNGPQSLKSDRPKQYYPIYYNKETNAVRVPKINWKEDQLEWEVEEIKGTSEEVIYPIHPNGELRVWRYSEFNITKEPDRYKVEYKDNQYEVYRKKYINEEGVLPRTWWDKSEYSARDNGTRELVNLFGDGYVFDFPKSVEAIIDSLRVCKTDSSSIVLDYFGGSGTTVQAVLNMNHEDNGNRKVVLVEMGEHFYNVILPRIKKLAFSLSWKNGNPTELRGKGAFYKYYELEQYEEALSKSGYNDAKAIPSKEIFEQYLFFKDEKLSRVLETKEDKIEINLSKLYPDIDIAETISNQTGRSIIKIKEKEVILEGGEVVDLENLDYKIIKPLIWW